MRSEVRFLRHTLATLQSARWISAGVAMLVAAACHGVQPIAPPATVIFELDAPLCSSVIPVELSIDGALAATDTFRVNLGNPHTRSRAFATAVGAHRLGARVVGGYVWTDTSVTLGAGQSFTRALPFYCS